jgi:hypothetical protein
MKISRLIIQNFQQFKSLDLDLTDPETGRPLEKVCFIGPNGTGKSTILRILFSRIQSIATPGGIRQADNSIVALKVHDSEIDFYGVAAVGRAGHVHVRSDIETDDLFAGLLDTNGDSSSLLNDLRNSPYFLPDLKIHKWKSDDLFVHVPADEPQLLKSDPPNTNLNNALQLNKNFPYAHLVSFGTAESFWNLLIFLIKKRESDYQQYLQRPENRRRIIEEVDEEFEDTNPKILPHIGELWNQILSPAGLEFDVANAQIPVQLNDNLQAHVRVKTSDTNLGYNQLSTGMRNFLFKLGHICSLYFGRKINRGFLFVDEPENSLYPDFLYDLVDQYVSITHNTQLFFATHNPIIAAQFRPQERVLLDFDAEAYVTARKGISPAGDDPNDLLEKDFRVRSLYGRVGVEKWERFLELRQLIKEATEVEDKKNLMLEFLNIGNTYNFDALSPQE